MADEADIANDFINAQLSRALDQLRQNNSTVKKENKICEECGEKIPVARRKLGFGLCIECAEQAERRGSLYGDY